MKQDPVLLQYPMPKEPNNRFPNFTSAPTVIVAHTTPAVSSAWTEARLPGTLCLNHRRPPHCQHCLCMLHHLTTEAYEIIDIL